MPAEIEFTVRLTVMSATGFRSASRRTGGMRRGVIKLQWLRLRPVPRGVAARRVGCRVIADSASGQSAVVNIVKLRVRCKMSDKKNAY